MTDIDIDLFGCLMGGLTIALVTSLLLTAIALLVLAA